MLVCSVLFDSFIVTYLFFVKRGSLTILKRYNYFAEF